MDNDAISDLFSGLGPIEIRRLFGGKGIYRNGLIVAIEIRGELMLKADAESAGDLSRPAASNGPTPDRATADWCRCPTGRCRTARSTSPMR